MKKFFFYFFILVIIAVTVEISAFLFTLTGFGRGYVKQYLPTYSINKALAIRIPFTEDHEVYGRWSQPYSEWRDKKTCFDVTYRANSIGARDRERTKISTADRTIALGDSIIAGVGVENAFRMTDLLEKQTGIEHLNFAYRSFGTTQEYLVYKHLAKSFSHLRVLLGVFPHNDFLNNDLKVAKTLKFPKYKPYYAGNYPKYRLVYLPETVEVAQDRKKKFTSDFLVKFKLLAREFTYAHRVLGEVKRRLNVKLTEESKSHNKSKFFSFKKNQLDLLRFLIKQIFREADGKKMTVLLIPSRVDFDSYNGLGETPLGKELQELGQDLGFQVIDLLPLMYRHTKDWDRYFFVCDGHFSHYGNEVLAHYLKEAVYGPKASVPGR